MNAQKLLEKIPIRVRLSLGHALWMAIIFGGIGIGVYRVVEESILNSLDATLLTSANTIRDAQTSQNPDGSHFHDPLYWESLVDEFLGGQRFVRAYAQLVETSGKVKARTSNVRVNLPVTPLALSRAERGLETFESFRISTGGYLRQLTLPVIRQGKFTGELIQVGSPMGATLSTIRSVRSMLWVSLSLGLGISVLFGYVLVAWSLRPVRRITQEVSLLGVSDNFNRRLKLPAADDELRSLAQTFNEMISRIDDGFTKLRRFAGDVSHELRTPLAVLRGEAELALRRERSVVEYQASLQTISNEAKQMSEIVEDLLLLARAQGGAIAIQWETRFVYELFDDIMGMVQKNFSEKSVKLLLNLGTCAGARLNVGGSYLALAIKNILLNACKHSSPQQVVNCDVLEGNSGEISIRISDQGEGIDPQNLPYIFDLFFRADTARNRSVGGVGIGLSLAKAFVALHGGSISAESKLGEGATFTITLPLIKANYESKLSTGNEKKTNSKSVMRLMGKKMLEDK